MTGRLAAGVGTARDGGNGRADRPPNGPVRRGREATDVRPADSDGYFGSDVVPAGVQPTVSGLVGGASRSQGTTDVR